MVNDSTQPTQAVTNTGQDSGAKPAPSQQPQPDPKPVGQPPAQAPNTPPKDDDAQGSFLGDDPAPADGAPPKEEPPKTEEQNKGVPEKYDLKLPEGSPLDPAQVDKISAIARERGLSNEQAQLLLEQKSEALSEYVESQKSQLAEKVESWKEEAENDKEYGGKEFRKNLELASRVVHRFGSENLRKALNASGLGNHPELVRMCVRIGKLMSDDQLVISNAQAGAEKSMAERWYGDSMNK